MTTPRVLHLQTLDACASTQQEARLLLDADASRIVVVRTRRQLQGVGRAGRRWHSPSGAALMVSIGMRGGMHVAVLEAFVRSVVDVVHTAIADVADVDPAAIAWSAPNDLVDARSGCKLAGVLVDAATVGDELCQLLVGVGVNVAGPEFRLPDEGRRVATLEHVAGRELDLDDAALDALARRIARAVALRAGVTPQAAPSA